jgi:hypothetical protein
MNIFWREESHWPLERRERFLFAMHAPTTFFYKKIYILYLLKYQIVPLSHFIYNEKTGMKRQKYPCMSVLNFFYFNNILIILLCFLYEKSFFF